MVTYSIHSKTITSVSILRFHFTETWQHLQSADIFLHFKYIKYALADAFLCIYSTENVTIGAANVVLTRTGKGREKEKEKKGRNNPPHWNKFLVTALDCRIIHCQHPAWLRNVAAVFLNEPSADEAMPWCQSACRYRYAASLVSLSGSLPVLLQQTCVFVCVTVIWTISWVCVAVCDISAVSRLSAQTSRQYAASERPNNRQAWHSADTEQLRVLRRRHSLLGWHLADRPPTPHSHPVTAVHTHLYHTHTHTRTRRDATRRCSQRLPVRDWALSSSSSQAPSERTWVHATAPHDTQHRTHNKSIYDQTSTALCLSVQC